MRAIYIDELPWHDGYGVIQNHFDEIEMPQIESSYHYLYACLLGMNYEEYLTFCRESLGAKISRKNGAKYAAIHFPITGDFRRFVDLLNKKFYLAAMGKN